MVPLADGVVIDPDFRDEKSSLRRKTNRIWIRQTSGDAANVCMETLSASDKDVWLEKLAAWRLPSFQVSGITPMCIVLYLHRYVMYVCM